MGLSRDELEVLADLAADEWDIPRRGFRALIQQESHWNPDAVSSAGAFGLTQLMPETAAEVSGWYGWSLDDVDPWDPATQLLMGARYLDWLHRRTQSWPLALAAYNGGIGRAERALEERGADWLQGLPAETRTYVAILAPQFPAEDEERPGVSYAALAAAALGVVLLARA